MLTKFVEWMELGLIGFVGGIKVSIKTAADFLVNRLPAALDWENLMIKKFPCACGRTTSYQGKSAEKYVNSSPMKKTPKGSKKR